MDKKIKIGSIVLGVVFLLLIIGSVSYQIWRSYQVGNLAIVSDQSDVAYQISRDANTFAGDQTLYFLAKGRYEVKAFGLTPGIFLPKTTVVEVKGNQTTTVNLKLDLNPNGPNKSGEEGP